MPGVWGKIGGSILGQNKIFGTNKTLEKPLFQQKTTIEHTIYEVSRPGQNSFVWYLCRDGTVFMSYLGLDGTVCMYILGPKY